LPSFLEFLQNRIMVCDGAMGTLLYERGISYEHCFDEVNLSQPDLIKEIHTLYVEAGADIIETNTFGANRFRLKNHGLDHRVKEINRKGACLARQVADSYISRGRTVFVAGSVGPLGKPIEPIGRIRRQDAQEYFSEQIAILADEGVDAIMIETMSDLREAMEAVMAARAVADLPIIVQMSFTEDGKTLMGNKPLEIAQEIQKAGVMIVGANCSVGPQILLDVLDKMNKVEKIFLTVQPNAGLPRFVGGRYIYLASPDYFADYTRLFIQSGARIIGGCCGTTPEHIRMIRSAVDGYAREPIISMSYISPATTDADETPLDASAAEDQKNSSLVEQFRSKKFTVCVEIDPPRGLLFEKVLQGAILCKAHQVDAINIADNPLAKAGMTPLAMAMLIRESVQIETILHVSCRDRNLLALQSELMSASVSGIRSVLCVTGDPPVVGDYPDATGVYDIDAIGLLKLIANLNQGLDLAGKSIGSKTNFYKACAINPTAVDLDKEYDRFEQKLEAGADFAMTQILYDIRPLEDFLKRYGGKIPVLAGIMPLKNAKHANFMHFEIPDITVPETIRNRMFIAGEKAPAEGIAIAKEFLKEVHPMVQGIYIIPPFNNFESALSILEVIR